MSLDQNSSSAGFAPEITNIFEVRQSINCNRPSDWIVRTYYAIETLLLEDVKGNRKIIAGNRANTATHSGAINEVQPTQIARTGESAVRLM